MCKDFVGGVAKRDTVGDIVAIAGGGIPAISEEGSVK